MVFSKKKDDFFSRYLNRDKFLSWFKYRDKLSRYRGFAVKT
jgi:hypothetical protein